MSLHSININNTDTNKSKRDVNIAKDQLNDLSSQIVELCKNKDNSVEPRSVSDHIQSMVMNFLSSIPNDFDEAVEYLELIISSSVPKDLVMLYLNQNYRMIAYTSIREFISSFKNDPLKPIYAFIALKFCKILRENVKTDDGLYRICRSSLGAMIEFTGITRCKYEQKKLVSLNSVFPFLMEISAELSLDLDSTKGTSGFEGLSFTLVRDFSAFLLPVWNVLWLMDNVTYEEKFFEKIDLPFCEMFYDLLAKVTLSLRLLDSKKVKKDIVVPWWSLYLDILNDLQSISKLYIYMEDDFWQNMKQVKGSLCYLITNFAEKSEHYEWIFEHKEVTNFYIRRQLAMMMLPEVEDNVEDQYNMLIDRSRLIVDSFNYITKLKYLPGSFFVQFKEEQAIGPGVLREWFLLACQEIFNPNNALFVACPDDNRSFFPNQASGVNPLHLEYFQFSGRMIALALAYDVQIGVAFDRAFFLQLVGCDVSLEEIRDTDPLFYRSCKDILHMDADTVDGDMLGLTFVCEFESLGLRREIELCPNGKDMVVDSKNREAYVDLLIQHRFVTSIEDQVAYFSKGFSDVITKSEFFFRCLSLEDFNLILGGRIDISVEDWRAHTDYNGYDEESDVQISWFWKIVETMSVEQKKMLLFFWTSMKSLPFDGFGGLDSKLSIHKTLEPDDHLPSSHTCFYQLCLPVYQSMTDMKDQLMIITQRDIASSFGTL